MTNPLTEKLRPHVKAIKAAIANGDRQAEQIVQLYELYRACPSDYAAAALCSEVFDEWMRTRNG